MRHVTSTGSTNDDLAEEARAGSTSPCVLVTDHQTAGRGRLGRAWADDVGQALLVSFRLRYGPDSALDAAACLTAAARAAADAACPVPVATKWPNDLVVEDGPAPGKLAGMLAELVTGDRDTVVIGLGLNLEPAPGQPAATSIRECGGSPDLDRILAAVIDGLGERLSDPARARDEIRVASATIGRAVRVDLGSTSIVGTAVDLTDAGELVLATDDGERVLSAGDVVHLRSVEPGRGD